MNARCASCGLMNLAPLTACRRCGSSLGGAGPAMHASVPPRLVELGVPVLDYDPRRVRLYSAARNYLWLAAFAMLLPWLIIVMLTIATPTEWSGGTTALTLISAVNTALLVTGGVLCGRGKSAGQWVAAPALLQLALLIPVGTVFAVKVSRVVSYAFNDD